MLPMPPMRGRSNSAFIPVGRRPMYRITMEHFDNALPTIILRPREERRLRHGHLWVFSNEIARIDGTVAPGALVRVAAGHGAPLGVEPDVDGALAETVGPAVGLLPPQAVSGRQAASRMAATAVDRMIPPRAGLNGQTLLIHGLTG